MFDTSKLRNGFLATISMGLALVTIYAIADPQVGNRQVADFGFPDEIPLNHWQQLSSESLTITRQPDENGELIEAAKRYSYRQDELNLILEIRYLVGTRGNLASLLTEYLEFSPAAIATQKTKNIPEVGSYLLIQEASSYNSYLSSCFTSFGHSIADQKEFSAMLNQVKLTPTLLWNWLWGKDSIRDRRCLWVHITLSTPKQELNDNQDLEQVWLELNQWWKPRFPQL